jgi:hypothetical protein
MQVAGRIIEDVTANLGDSGGDNAIRTAEIIFEDMAGHPRDDELGGEGRHR